MKAVITVIGKDKVGIIYHVSKILWESDANILDISKTIMEDMFTMMMMVDISNINISFEKLHSLLEEKGKEIGLSIKIMHEDIFNSMHRI